MPIRVIKSTLAFEGRAFNVRKDEIHLPDGTNSLLDIVEHRDSVTMIPVDENGDIWLIKQYRHAAGKYLLELPAGVMEEGETPLESAQRELREEIGMRAYQLSKIGGGYLAPGYSTEYNHFILASQLSRDPLPGDVGEILEVITVPWQTAIAKVTSGEIEDAKTIAALLLAASHLQEMFR